MRMLDVDREHGVRKLQFYLSVTEATQLRDELSELLQSPEANEHLHVFAEDMSRELSCSIVTDSKLRQGGYTRLERDIFDER
jgi:hypothetical protein